MNLPVDARQFDRRSAEILDEFEAEWGWMYKTTDERGRERTIDYTVWSEVFTCPSCAGPIVFYDVAFNERNGHVSKSPFDARSCGKRADKESSSNAGWLQSSTLAGDTIDRIEFRPVAIHYRVGRCGSQSKPLDDADSAFSGGLRRACSAWPRCRRRAFPIHQMVHGRAPIAPKGFTHVHHFWGDRALAGALRAVGMCAE